MPKFEFAKFRKSVFGLIIGAIGSAAIALLANLYTTASAFKQNLRHQERLQLTRTANFLVIVRDEIAAVQRNIEDGSLAMGVFKSNLSRPSARWPTQMWTVARWNADLLNMESALLRLLASVYDDIYRLDGLVDAAARMQEGGSVMAPILRALSTDSEIDEKTKKAFQAGLDEPSPELKIVLDIYSEGIQRIKRRLPDVLTALDLKIAELQTLSHQ